MINIFWWSIMYRNIKSYFYPILLSAKVLHQNQATIDEPNFRHWPQPYQFLIPAPKWSTLLVMLIVYGSYCTGESSPSLLTPVWC